MNDETFQKYEVTPIELFFDLVYAFAMSQLSHHLLTHLSWRGFAETLVLLLAVFTVWAYTSWSAAIVGVVNSRTRWMILAVMLPGLFMNAAVPTAFSASAWAFVVPMLLIQLGRTAWTIWASQDEIMSKHHVRTLIWLLASSLPWVAGAWVNAEARLYWWMGAAGLDLLGSWLAHPLPGKRLESENLAFDGEHMLERARLFLLIALGETVLTTGMALTEASMNPMLLLTGISALLGTIALWSLTFSRADRIVHQHVKEANDPIRAAIYSINTLTALVAGLISMAVANKLAIVQPLGHGSAAFSVLLFGGPILFLLAQSAYLCAELKERADLQLAGCALLAVAGFLTLSVPPWLALVAVGMILTILALIDYRLDLSLQSEF